jgi:hypothetical protein
LHPRASRRAGAIGGSAAGDVLFDLAGDGVADLSERTKLLALLGIANGIGLPTKHHCLIEPKVCVEHTCLRHQGYGSAIASKFTLLKPSSKQKMQNQA